jgi:FixJ family two-component response regulator
MRLGETGLAQAETILIAVSDGVLADSLRFSLELEGFETRFCDEYSLFDVISTARARAGCLVLDQDVFARMVDGTSGTIFADCGMPVVLMASHVTKRVLTRASAAGVTEVVEKPLLGAALFTAIRQAIDSAAHSSPPGGAR